MFVPNNKQHRLTRLGDTKDSTGALEMQGEAWRKEAAETAEQTVIHGAGKLGALVGAMYLSLSKPPSVGNCGEMAVLTYRKVITLAIRYDCPMAVAAVSIGADWGSGGNHSFVLMGSDASFATLLNGNPPVLEVTTDSLPAGWGDNVYVCDPWIDSGRCPTFKATGRGKGYVTPWETFLNAVQVQAKDAVIKRAFNTAGGRLRLIVDDCVVISNSSAGFATAAAPAAATAGAGGGGGGSSSSSSSSSPPAKKPV
jgi:hypothetical protein